MSACSAISTAERITASTKPAELYVVVLDGVGFEYLEKIDPEFVRDYSVERLNTVFPSNSFSTQVSIATGKEPFEHGVVNNHFYWKDTEGERKYYRGDPTLNHLILTPTIWNIAPEQFDAYTYGYMFSYPIGNDKHRYLGGGKKTKIKELFAAANLLLDQSASATKPILFFSWNIGLDTALHINMNSAQAPLLWAEFRREFTEFKTRIDSLRAQGRNVSLLVLSDHGLSPIRHTVNRKLLLKEINARLSTSIEGMDFLAKGATLSLYQSEGSEVVDLDEFKLAVEGVLKPALESANLSTEIQWYESKHPRSGVIMMELPPNIIFAGGKTLVSTARKNRGMHGWNSKFDTAMDGIVFSYPPVDNTPHQRDAFDWISKRLR